MMYSRHAHQLSMVCGLMLTSQHTFTAACCVVCVPRPRQMWRPLHYGALEQPFRARKTLLVLMLGPFWPIGSPIGNLYVHVLGPLLLSIHQQRQYHTCAAILPAPAQGLIWYALCVSRGQSLRLLLQPSFASWPAAVRPTCCWQLAQPASNHHALCTVRFNLCF